LKIHPADQGPSSSVRIPIDHQKTSPVRVSNGVWTLDCGGKRSATPLWHAGEISIRRGGGAVRLQTPDSEWGTQRRNDATKIRFRSFSTLRRCVVARDPLLERRRWFETDWSSQGGC
jgi:hypothetical protein